MWDKIFQNCKKILQTEKKKFAYRTVHLEWTNQEGNLFFDFCYFLSFLLKETVLMTFQKNFPWS